MNKKETAKAHRTLFSDLIEAKQLEYEAVAHRQAIEAELYEYLRPMLTKTDGQETVEQFGYSAVVNQPMTYKLKEKKYRELAETLPEEMQFHRTKLEVDKTKYKNILSAITSDKAMIRKMQDCIEIVPGKVSISVKQIR